MSFILLLTLASATSPDSIQANAPVDVVIEGFPAPTGLAMDPSSNLYFSDTKDGSIFQFSPERGLFFLSDGIKKPRALVLDQGRSLFISADRLEEKAQRRGVLSSSLT